MTPILVHEGARRERLHARRRYEQHDPAVAARFDDALRALFVRTKEAPSQFSEHALLAIPAEAASLFFAVRRVLLPRPLVGTS